MLSTKHIELLGILLLFGQNLQLSLHTIICYPLGDCKQAIVLTLYYYETHKHFLNIFVNIRIQIVELITNETVNSNRIQYGRLASTKSALGHADFDIAVTPTTRKITHGR